MKKLLAVVLVALLSVGAFAAVTITGYLEFGPALTYDASASTFEAEISPYAKWYMRSTSSDQLTGFDVRFATQYPNADLQANLTWGTMLWHKIYVSDPLTVTLQVGMLSRGWSYVKGSNFSWTITPPYFVWRNRTNAVAAKFDMAAGELKDSLTVYVHTPVATQVDVDVYNSLSFNVVNVGVLVKTVLTDPEVGVGVSVDLAKALNISNATLKGFGYMALDITATDITSMLSDYMFGVDFGYDKFNGSVAFQKPQKLGVALTTTILEPVTVGAELVWDDLTDVTAFNLAGYLSWKTGLLGQKAYVTYGSNKVKVGWKLSTNF